MTTPVVALYVDPEGPYPALVEDWYDKARDATTYPGDLPVVAHPPCGPWGRLHHLCKHQDATLAPVAVEQVQRFGGVLEHPAHSRLWKECGLPLPGQPSLFVPGFTLAVEQWRWGHYAIKPTWLYVVGLRGELPELPPEPSRPHSPPCQWRISSVTGKLYRRGGGMINSGRSKHLRHLTPPALASWLVDLASRCHAP